MFSCFLLCFIRTVVIFMTGKTILDCISNNKDHIYFIIGMYMLLSQNKELQKRVNSTRSRK